MTGRYTKTGTDSATESVEELDLKSGTPEEKECAPMQKGRGMHAMIAQQNENLVFGGHNGSKKSAFPYRK